MYALYFTKILIFGVLITLYKEQLTTKRHYTTVLNNDCIIRIYERQYYMGNHWTLHPNGTWTSYRQSNFKVPYGRFEIKSLRMYGPSYCRWKVCSIYSRKYRRRKCRMIEAARKKISAPSEDGDGKTIFLGMYIGYQIDIVSYNVMSRK